MLVTITTTGGAPAVNRWLVLEGLQQCHQCRHTRRCTGRSWPALPVELEAQLLQPPRASRSRQSLPCPGFTKIPAQRASRRANQEATSACNLTRLCPASPNIVKDGEKPKGSSLLCHQRPQSHTTPSHCLATQSLETPWELQGPRGRRRCT